jgi:hypothetical protein
MAPRYEIIADLADDFEREVNRTRRGRTIHQGQQRTHECSKQYFYSITSSARASSDGGTVRPSVLAVLRFITSTYLIGACTGRSAGFSPLRMRST